MTHIDQLHPRIQWVDNDGYLTNFAFRFLTSTWEKLGGPEDFIEDTQIGELYEPGVVDGRIVNLERQLNNLELTVELIEKESRIAALEKRIDALELELDHSSNNADLDKRISIIEMELALQPISKMNLVRSTDNAIARFNGSGGQVQDSGATIGDDGNITASQTSATGAVPVIALTQADVSEEFLRLTGTAASGNLTQSIVAEADVTTATRAGWVKVYVVDDGNQITDQAYFVPLYTLA